MTVRPHFDEAERLASLLRYGILDAEPDPAFTDFVAVALELCGAPIGAICLLENGALRFKAQIGISADDLNCDIRYCAHTILDSEIYIVEDLTADPLFSNSPIVTGEPNVRFYAGVPLMVGGDAIGALFVMDAMPRTLTGAQGNALMRLKRTIETQLELTGTTIELNRVLAHRENREVSSQVEAQKAVDLAESKYRTIFENAVIGIFQTTPEGAYLSANSALARMYGYEGADDMMNGLTDIKTTTLCRSGTTPKVCRRIGPKRCRDRFRGGGIPDRWNDHLDFRDRTRGARQLRQSGLL